MEEQPPSRCWTSDETRSWEKNSSWFLLYHGWHKNLIHQQKFCMKKCCYWSRGGISPWRNRADSAEAMGAKTGGDKNAPMVQSVAGIGSPRSTAAGASSPSTARPRCSAPLSIQCAALRLQIRARAGQNSDWRGILIETQDCRLTKPIDSTTD